MVTANYQNFNPLETHFSVSAQSLQTLEKLPLFFTSEKIHQLGIEDLGKKENQVSFRSGNSSLENVEIRPLKKEIDELQIAVKLDHQIEQTSECETIGHELTKKQIHFFTYQEPSEWFSLYRDHRKQIRFNFPRQMSKIKKLIYIFRNKTKCCFLIGKTGNTLKGRMAKYASWFNDSASEQLIKKAGRKAFIADVKEAPDDFEVGILHVLQPEEDLDMFETLFIDYKRTVYQLYNDHRGGGGGLAHSEETPTIYAIPKPETASYTPVKYYPYGRDIQGNIRPQFTPGFKRRMWELRENMEETQIFVYAIKKIKREDSVEKVEDSVGTPMEMIEAEYYIGISGDSEIRALQHGYAAEYCDPKHKKYDPSRISGLLHSAMAQQPEAFRIGLLPVRSINSIPQEEQDGYIFLSTIAKVEQYSIQIKHSHFSEKGFNCTWGGEGSLPRRVKKDIVKKISF